MNDLIKKRRKTATKYLRLDAVEKEYDVEINDIINLLKEGDLESFGKFDSDFTISEPRDRKPEIEIAAGTWKGNLGWEYQHKKYQLVNNDDYQCFTDIMFVREKFEKKFFQHYDPKKVKARIYNWELVITQMCIYLHDKEIPKTKKAWIKQIVDEIPYFKSGMKPEIKALDKHLGVIWKGLNQESIDWNQWVKDKRA